MRTGNGYTFDLHEFTITPRNTALVLAYERYERSLKAFGGPKDAKIVDNIVQEIDIKTGLVLFEWHSFGNVSPDESNIPVPEGEGLRVGVLPRQRGRPRPRRQLPRLRPQHVDDLQDQPRHGQDHVAPGRQEVRLQARRRACASTGSTRSARSRTATYSSTTTRAAPPTRKASRAIDVKLDEQAKTATLVSAFTHPRKLLSASQGNVERLPNGNVFVGWGSQRWFTEFSPSGEVLFDGRLARGNDNYRAFRYEWIGPPSQPPKVVASTASGKITARVSWNGATDVARWELLAGADADSLVPIGSRPPARASRPR